MIFTRNGLEEVSLNRRKGIKYKCSDCSGFEYSEVVNCSHSDCPLFRFRTGNGEQDPGERNRAIKDYCTWCMDGQTAEISKCTSVNCPLYEYRGYLLQKTHIEAIPDTISNEPVQCTNLRVCTAGGRSGDLYLESV